ncbi:Ankyrin repeat-containing protein ITN1 [Bienertia sinuspersici]
MVAGQQDDETFVTPQFQAPFNLLSEYLNYGIPLYKAALRGDWDAATQIRSAHSECFAARITKQGDTALHIAALAGRTDFVVQLVTVVAKDCRDNLALKNNNENTALCLAAASGSVEIARVMVDEHNELPMIRGNGGLTPLHMAALLGHREMVRYLLPLTWDNLSDEEHIALFISTINTDLYDISLEILQSHPQLAIARDENEETPLHVLAKKSLKYSYACQLVERLWNEVLNQKQENISQLMRHPWRLLFVAVQVGNVDFLTTLICSYPDLIWKLDDNFRSIFHVAVQYRQEKIFRLVYEIGAIKDLLATYVDKSNGNNILHLAGLLPSSDRLNCISGAALQMQQEMLWFKVVECLVQPQLAEAQNTDMETPRTLFTKEHKELRKEGEEWMRKTASSCSFVATLIASVVFAAALKVPGNDTKSFTEPLNHGAWYWLFAISDSLSLISSTASILMFLSILTSRYAEEDFLHSLPRKLMIGLTLLFISIATMMIAFTATIHIMFRPGWLSVGTSVLACIPIILFAKQEFPLLLEVYRSTIGCNFTFKARHHQLF